MPIFLFFTTLIILLVILLYLVFYFCNNANNSPNLKNKNQISIKKEYEKKIKHLKQKAYQAEVLRELSERIGYSLDIPKIIEVITGSLGEVLSYHTASYLIREEDHLKFHCFVSQPVNHRFIKNVKSQMIKAYGVMIDSDLSNKYVEEAVSGTILDDTLTDNVESFFNIPLIISGKIVGVINVSSPKKNLYTEEETRILYEITEQASAHYDKLQNVLQEEQRKLNSMVASMADGVIMLDKDLQILVFNPAARSMLDLSEIENPTILDIANNLSGKVDLRTKLDKALQEDKIVEQKNIFLKDKALHLLISPVKDKNNELLGSAILFRDITAEKELEQMREEFTAMMVHELRTPLTTIKGTTDMILNEKRIQKEVKEKLLKTMEEEAENMLVLVGELLDVAKIEAGKFQISPQKGNIVSVVKKSVDKFMPQAQKKGLKLTTSFSENIPEIYFDPIRIDQVLNNLLSNAIKYTEKGFIQVEISKDKKFVKISVRDNGAGMAPEELSALFSKFKQFGKGKSGKIKGTGLGLVIAKGIVETHNGKIKAESEGIGQGSVFSFTLPVGENEKRNGGEKS